MSFKSIDIVLSITQRQLKYTGVSMSYPSRALLSSLVVLGSLVAIHAKAGDVSFSGYVHGAQTVQTSVTTPAGAYNGLTPAGAFAASYNGISFTTYCIELNEPVGFGTTYTNYNAVAGSAHTFANSNAALDIGKLFAEGNVVNTATTEAAFQIAVWELTYETSGKYNLNTGSATFSGGEAAQSGALELASAWLGDLSKVATSGRFALSANGTMGYSTTVLESKAGNGIAGQQDQIFSSRIFIDTMPAPIPEPSTYALMFTGLMAVGFLARRRSGK
jgi:hypothetical protein